MNKEINNLLHAPQSKWQVLQNSVGEQSWSPQKPGYTINYYYYCKIRGDYQKIPGTVLKLETAEVGLTPNTLPVWKVK